MAEQEYPKVDTCTRWPQWERVVPFTELVELGRQVADHMPGSVLWAPGVMWCTVDDTHDGQPVGVEWGRIQRYRDVLPFDALPMLNDWATFGVVRRAVMCIGAAFGSRLADCPGEWPLKLEYQGTYRSTSGDIRKTPWYGSEIEAVAAVVVGFDSE